MQERRRFPRWRIDRPARIKLEGAEAFMACHVPDINLKGLQICLKQKLPRDTFLKLTVVFSEEYIIMVEVWLVWHKSIDGHNSYGLYFNRIKDSDKETVYKFVHKHFHKEICKQWWRDLAQEKGGGVMEDHRIFERLPVQLPLRLLDVNNGRECKGTTCDISAKGVGFSTDESLTARAPLEIWFEVPGMREPLYTRGEVVWSKMVAPNAYRAGVSLEKADLMGLARVLRAT